MLPLALIRQPSSSLLTAVKQLRTVTPMGERNEYVLDRLLCPSSPSPQQEKHQESVILWWGQKITSLCEEECEKKKISPRSHFLRSQQKLHTEGLTAVWVCNWFAHLEGDTAAVFPPVTAPTVQLVMAPWTQHFSWARAADIPAPQASISTQPHMQDLLQKPRDKYKTKFGCVFPCKLLLTGRWAPSCQFGMNPSQVV